jgi:hypothetical protein
MICVVYTDGLLKVREIAKECKKQKWIPICVYREKSAVNKVPTVIIFHNQSIAKQFAKRNLPKEWPLATIQMHQNDLAFIKSKGWNFEVFSFPRLMTTHPLYEISFEIIELADEPDLNYRND